MTKNDLIRAVASETGLKKKDAEAAVCAVFDTIEKSLADGEKVQIVGFGTFDCKTRPEHQGRNPFSGESITVPASRYPSFAAGKSLKEAVH